MDDAQFKARIVSIARRWIGTDYCHQASLEGVGADCLGLFRGIWRELFDREPADLPVYTSDWNVAEGERLSHAAKLLLNPLRMGEERPGDVVLFRMRDNGPAKHLGILAQNECRSLTFIHSYSLHGVVETAFTPAWRRRVDGFFAIPARSS